MGRRVVWGMLPMIWLLLQTFPTTQQQQQRQSSQHPRIGHFQGQLPLPLDSDSHSLEASPVAARLYARTPAPSSQILVPNGFERFLRRSPSPSDTPKVDLSPILGRGGAGGLTFHELPLGAHSHPHPNPSAPPSSPSSGVGVGQDSEIVYEYYEEPDSDLQYQYVTESSSEKSKGTNKGQVQGQGHSLSPEHAELDSELDDGLKLRGRSVHPQPPRSNLALEPYRQSLPSSTKRPAILHSAFVRDRNHPVTPEPKVIEESNKSEGLGSEDYAYYEEEYELHPPSPTPSQPKVKTKMTLSVSTQSSSTTVSPPISSEEKPSSGSGVVISVATTKSVSAGLGPQQMTTPRPSVTFSRATGSSIVVASVQTSRSVAVPLESQATRTVAVPAHPHPHDVQVNTESPEYYEDEDAAYPDNYPLVGGGLSSSQPTILSPSPTPSESIMDKLDRVQSDLVNGLLSGLPVSTKNNTESHGVITSTTRGPDPNLIIKFEDNSAFLPPGYKASIVPTTTTTTSTTTTTTTTSTTTTTTPPPSTTTEEATTTTTTTSEAPILPGLPKLKFKEISFDSLAGLLPRDYKVPTSGEKKESEPRQGQGSSAEVKPKTHGFSGKFKPISLSALLPNGYKVSTSTTERTIPTTTTPTPTTTTTTTTTTTGSPVSVSADPDPSTSESPPVIPGIKFEDASSFLSLLPSNFKLPPRPTQEKEEETKTTTTTTTAKSVFVPSQPSSTEKTSGGLPGSKLVFPTRPGALKTPTRHTTPEPSRAETPLPQKVMLKTGWPTRKTTEFTGWPTVSTVATTTMSTTPSTTTTTIRTTVTTTPTTTVAPPKRSSPSTCESAVCRMDATLRIVGGVNWRPEYADKNTDEWKQLESIVKRELDGAYRSSGLAGLYKSIEIEAFNRGSILVDYFLLLNTSERVISSDQVRSLFHGSLLQAQPSDDETETSGPLYDGRLRFGRYTIDPRYTEFQVRNGTTETIGVGQPDVLIPQWGIAVIVIGLVSFMFIVIFGVTVLVGRHRRAKKSNAVSLTQEMLNEFNKSHNMGVGVDNYGVDDLYNMDDVWNDSRGHVGVERDRTLERKPPKPRSTTSGGKGSPGYNIYDSWKTEWNGYYQNGNYYGDSGYAPSRRRSDYDTNF